MSGSLLVDRDCNPCEYLYLQCGRCNTVQRGTREELDRQEWDLSYCFVNDWRSLLVVRCAPCFAIFENELTLDERQSINDARYDDESECDDDEEEPAALPPVKSDPPKRPKTEVINPQIRVGAAADPPADADELMVRLKHCPHCDGRGWFLHNPFATGGGNGAGGVRNMRQCLSCLDCKAFYDVHGTMPAGYEIPVNAPEGVA